MARTVHHHTTEAQLKRLIDESPGRPRCTLEKEIHSKQQVPYVHTAASSPDARPWINDSAAADHFRIMSKWLSSHVRAPSSPACNAAVRDASEEGTYWDVGWRDETGGLEQGRSDAYAIST